MSTEYRIGLYDENKQLIGYKADAFWSLTKQRDRAKTHSLENGAIPVHLISNLHKILVKDVDSIIAGIAEVNRRRFFGRFETMLIGYERDGQSPTFSHRVFPEGVEPLAPRGGTSMTKPSLTHPATNPDGTCNNQSCPCQQWSKQAAATTDDTVSDCEPERPTINYSEYMRTFKYPPDNYGQKQEHVIILPSDPHPHSEDNLCAICDGGLAICKLCGKAEVELNELCVPSTALRNTRSIVHHAEMVEEQKRTQTTFEQYWQEAPKSIKHGCEQASAEFFYHAGRRDRETEMLREVNTVLSGVAQRIGQERLR